MKCPHCGMNIRDTVEVCGYCGGKIADGSERSPSENDTSDSYGSQTDQDAGGEKIQAEGQSDGNEDEEGGGISVYLQPGEQVLIGSLNVAVKKFFFHAYLTNQRIFLIDTQEKKVKVTAKDIPRDTIAGAIIEFSESSDPVLVLSLKSTDDEIKTMKLVFIQGGMDRSDEIDEWITLLHEMELPEKSAVQKTEERTELPDRSVPVKPEESLQKQELQPKRKPGKDHEKQPPVKRHILVHNVEDQEPEAEITPAQSRRPQIREIPEPVKKHEAAQEPDKKTSSPVRTGDIQPVRKHEVQSAMKVAMKNAMQPLKSSSFQTKRRSVTEPEASLPKQAEPEHPKAGRSGIREQDHKTVYQDDETGTPPFCHNCGKKTPPAANFCPGCGTKLGTHRTRSNDSIPDQTREKKVTHTEPARERKEIPVKENIDEGEREDETPVTTKLPPKKLPKGSEMTILHKFLRR